MNHHYLIRIVRLTLLPDKCNEFNTMFEAKSQDIRHFDGCHKLELLQDITYPHIVSTYSIWENEEALNSYRASELFKSTWKQTKTMFAAPPVAHSHFLLRAVE